MSSLRRTLAAAVALVAMAGLAACSGGDTSSSASSTSAGTGATDTFPISIDSALGTATIPAEPTRVVTWGWGSTEAALALGVTPVAIQYQDYAGDDNGMLPWVTEKLEADGLTTPTVLPNQQDVPVEAIAAAQPDLILATYSGITQSEYDQLEQIAPVVAYPDAAWSTPWKDNITLVAQALGRSAAGAELLASIEQEVADQAAAHPEFAGKTIALVYPGTDMVSVYTPEDARASFMLDLGFTTAPAVTALAPDDATFYYDLSAEKLNQLDADVLVAFGASDDEIDAFLATSAGKLLPQTAAGTVAKVGGEAFVSAVSPPTALSLSWGLQDYVDVLSAAVANAG